MSLWIPDLAGCVGIYLRIADPIFPIRASAISFALFFSRAMNSRIIVWIQSMIPDILRRLVDLRNSGYSGNFNGNGALKTVCLSDTKRARHGRNQMPVLLGDLIQKSCEWMEGAALIFKEQIPFKEQSLLSRYLKTDCMNALQVLPVLMCSIVHDFLRIIKFPR